MYTITLYKCKVVYFLKNRIIRSTIHNFGKSIHDLTTMVLVIFFLLFIIYFLIVFNESNIWELPELFISFQVDRRTQVDIIARHRLYNGVRGWRKLIHCLIELHCLFGPFGDHLCNPERVCSHFYMPVCSFIALIFNSKIVVWISRSFGS